ncbi:MULTISPECIES: CatB-related O-acetyltransferase [Myroides]|uniref:Antibiotic acetyltransferase n=1 Tax=Myroides albus TaxID=2562892 RepID=A0A6I3LSM2_9FLAO|nr:MULTISPECIES: CatB-related O-acetyltransferase [Myroides]MTG99092.1 antibiotic acetyltransferase [Myroides albus]MVX36253.1 antibiotic acetyltransferase [Myroides sp. LoEW2-1]UVD80710.1 CatB-related O-acetyltransferase [Myroides albus]
MKKEDKRHWSKVEYLHETVKNPNIHIKGTTSYYSNAWTGNFEESVVRYLYGDEYSLNTWDPIWHIDQLYIGAYVCIAAEVVILMGGNNTHRTDWFSLYPFTEIIEEAYQAKGDTIIEDGAWLGMRSMIMPGITIGEGAIVASGAVVIKDVEPYTIVAGNPAKPIKKRFSEETIKKLMDLKIYDWPEEKFHSFIKLLCNNNIDELIAQNSEYTKGKDSEYL